MLRSLTVCIFSLVLVLATACEGDSRNRRASRGVDFVSDPDHLYFKNIRAGDYRSEEVREGVDAYYHDGQTETPPLVIYDYWLEDRAELQQGDHVFTDAEAREYLARLRRQDRSAATEVVEDYLRMTGN